MSYKSQYYKHITIVNNTSRVVTISSNTLESSIMVLEALFTLICDVYSRGVNITMCTLKNATHYLKTNIYYYLETSGCQRSNLYLDAVHFFNTSVN
jgi:hypothetical protein